MERVLAVAAMIGVLAAWGLFLYRKSDGRLWSPLWMAFGSTLAAGIFLGAGAVGYTLSRHDRFVAGTGWSGGVIWWEIWVGIAAATIAFFMWRRGLRSLRA